MIVVPNKTSQTVSSTCGPPKRPDELRFFAEPSLLLPGEDPRDYEDLRQMIVEDIQPQNNIEWLWVLDLIELSDGRSSSHESMPRAAGRAQPARRCG